jgi:hypothetical protein
MSLKKGGGPALLEATLTITGQGSTDQLKITFHNRRGTEVEAKLKEGGALASVLPFIVKEWDTDFPLTEEGIREMEDEYPGMVEIMFSAFWRARRKELEKNS